MKRSLLLAALLLISPLLAACPTEVPVPTESGIVTNKRRPCGNDGKCVGNEVNCWQLQVKTSSGKVGFNCVSQAVWNKTKVGQKYP